MFAGRNNVASVISSPTTELGAMSCQSEGIAKEAIRGDLSGDRFGYPYVCAYDRSIVLGAGINVLGHSGLPL